MGKSFQFVCALWVTPDFSATLAGKRPAPRVNHSTVNFVELADALTQLFPFGPPVRIQVPNDTIDQVAVHVRASRSKAASMRCEDFGKSLLNCAKTDANRIIDVSNAWTALHELPARDFAPPPVILPFVVTALDFEDAMIWRSSTRPILGLPAFNLLDAISAPNSVDHNGFLPQGFRGDLERIFGTPYDAPAVLDQMYMDQPPSEYRISV